MNNDYKYKVLETNDVDKFIYWFKNLDDKMFFK